MHDGFLLLAPFIYFPLAFLLRMIAGNALYMALDTMLP